MPNISLVIKYKKNEGLVYSPSELLSQYLHGISICTKDGRPMDVSTITQKIRTAQNQIEKFLSIRANPSVEIETVDFIRSDYHNWGNLSVNFPVKMVVDLTGFISTTRQVEFPFTWISSPTMSDETQNSRILHIVPAGSSTPHTNSVVFVGMSPNAGFFGVASIPNYWRIEYIAGFEVVPADIIDVISKLAVMQILAILGDILLGAGIASQSLSVDSFSQSIATTQSAENSAYSARVRQYAGELKLEMKRLKDWYKGITFMSM